MSDIHIKKDIKNLKLITNRCKNCENELINYCVDCGEKICLICSKKYENNSHENHKIINILEIIPSKDKIKNIKEKIRKKSDYFDSLIKSLDEWQNELNKKIERIKDNLKNEIDVIEKLFLNFNNDYLDYTYISNFNEFFKEIDKYNNQYLKQFKEAKNFNGQTKNIFDLILITDKINKELEIIKERDKTKEFFKDNIIEKMREDYFLFYSKCDKYICLLCDFQVGFYKYLFNTKINLNEEIFRFDYSPDRNRIYACLANKKSIYIINYDSEEKTLKLADEKIEIEGSGHFNKCIHINNNCLLIIDDYNVYLFLKNNSNLPKFTNTNIIIFDQKIYDIRPMFDNSALVSLKSKLSYINIENLKITKEIHKRDYLEVYPYLTIFKDCIVFDLEKDISIASIKTQEI